MEEDKSPAAEPAKQVPEAEAPTATPKPAKPVKRGFLRRYRPLVIAVLLAAALIGGAGYYASTRKAAEAVSGDFDPSTVLPAPVSQPAKSTVYNAESIKQFDGKNGHKCYVAVKSTVYEIKDSSYWQNGQHTPSGGVGYCGADMTEGIKQSPHGESYLERLPKVGIFESRSQE